MDVLPFLKKKSNEYECQNHNNKAAKFYVQSQTQYLYYCQNCAVRLASQGFSTLRISNNVKEPNPRMKQINEFMEYLEKAINNLKQKKIAVDNELTKSQNSLQEQLQKIQQYYCQFYQLIDEHKNRVIEQLKNEYDNACQDVKLLKQKVNDALQSSQNMKKDINQSLNQVILDASQYEFRPVMDLYKNNLTKFKTIYQQKPITQIKIKSLKFRGDQEAVCQKLLQQLIVQWDQSQQQEKYQSQVQSERKNPVQSLQSQQKQVKSNLKQLSQLFSSFDQ